MRTPLSRIWQFVGFVAAGGAATILNYAVFLFLLSMGVHYLAAGATGYLSGIAVSFAINFFLVFRAQGGLGRRAARYVVAYLLAMFAQLLVLWGLVALGIGPEISNAVAIVVVVVANYFVIRRYVFQMP